MHKACEFGHLDAVCYLLGLDKKSVSFLIQTPDDNNHTPLDYAIAYKHSKIEELLRNPESDESTILLLDKFKM